MNLVGIVLFLDFVRYSINMRKKKGISHLSDEILALFIIDEQVRREK